jgi:molecular chaperone GrpE (heat shock protein)
MLKWLRTLSGRKPQQSVAAPDERLLELEREAQGLRLDLEERERLIANLKGELERQRKGENTRTAEATRAQTERLLTDVAGPVAQLLTQAHLLEVEGKPVQAKDVLAVAKRLVRALEDTGLSLEGSVGAPTTFDPNRHEPLSADAALRAGDPVSVRFVGVTYQGKIIRKAGVEKARR